MRSEKTRGVDYDHSPSSISLWKECRLAYFNRYELKIPTTKNRWMIIGTLCHEALEFLATSEEGISVDALCGFMRTHPGVHDEELKQAAYDILGPILHKIDFKQTIALEEWWILEAAEGIRIGGIWDRIDMNPGYGVKILDYKSGAVHSREKIKKWPSTLLYLAAARDRWPDIEDIAIVFWFIKKDKPIRVSWSPEIDKEARGLVIQTHMEIEAAKAAEDFPARLGKHCRNCSYRFRCPAFQAATARREM